MRCSSGCTCRRTRSGTIPIRADAHCLACTDKSACPSRASLSLDLAGRRRRAQPRAVRRVAPGACRGRWRRSPISRRRGGRLRIAIPLPAASRSASPISSRSPTRSVDYEAPQSFRRSGDSLIAELRAQGATPHAIDGVLPFGDGRGPRIPRGAGRGPGGGRRSGWPRARRRCCSALLGALLGGMILNLMPCVFPILASRRCTSPAPAATASEARREALAYAAGAIAAPARLARSCC